MNWKFWRHRIELPESKKIVFINPPASWLEDPFMDAPLNLLMLAGVAKAEGWTVALVDMEWMGNRIPKADLYAVTATSPQYLFAKEILR